MICPLLESKSRTGSSNRYKAHKQEDVTRGLPSCQPPCGLAPFSVPGYIVSLAGQSQPQTSGQPGGNTEINDAMGVAHFAFCHIDKLISYAVSNLFLIILA